MFDILTSTISRKIQQTYFNINVDHVPMKNPGVGKRYLRWGNPGKRAMPRSTCMGSSASSPCQGQPVRHPCRGRSSCWKNNNNNDDDDHHHHNNNNNQQPTTNNHNHNNNPLLTKRNTCNTQKCSFKQEHVDHDQPAHGLSNRSGLRQHGYASDSNHQCMSKYVHNYRPYPGIFNRFNAYIQIGGE